MTTSWGGGGFGWQPMQIVVAQPCPVCSQPGVIVLQRERVAALAKAALLLAHPDRHPEERRVEATRVASQLNVLLSELTP